MTSAAHKRKSINSIEQGSATLGTHTSAGGETTGKQAKMATKINIICIYFMSLFILEIGNLLLHARQPLAVILQPGLFSYEAYRRPNTSMMKALFIS